MRSHRLLLAVPAAAILAFSLSGCAIAGQFASHQQEQVYPRWSDATSADGTQFSTATFVPSDAVAIRARWDTSDGGELLRFTTKSTLDPAVCTPGKLTGSPLMESSWWPEKVPKDGSVCAEGWQVFERGGSTYAWLSK